MRNFCRRFRSALSRAASASARAIAAALGGREVGLLVGLGMVGYGAGIVWLPAGFVLPGAVLLYVVIAGLR